MVLRNFLVELLFLQVFLHLNFLYFDVEVFLLL